MRRLRPLLLLVLVLPAALVSPGAAAASTFTSGGPYGAELSAIALDPFDPDHLIGLGSMTGVWWTWDGGATWHDAQWPALQWARTVAFDPTHQSVVYAGLDSGQVLRSTDGGSTWTTVRAGAPNDGDVSSLTVTSSGAIYAGVDSRGLIRSTDAGHTWRAADAGLPISPVTGAPPPPLFAASAPQTAYAGTSSGVFRTTDGGDSWAPTSPLPGGCSPAAFVRAVAPTDPSIVFASTTCGELYRTVDAGAMWTPEPVSGTWSVAFDPSNPNRAYAGVVDGIRQTSDGGQTWTAVTSVFDGQPAEQLVVDPPSATRIFAVTEAGVSRSTDSGTSWTPASSGMLSDWFVHAVVSDPGNRAVAYAATQGGLFTTRDGGATWRQASTDFAPSGMEVRSIVIDPASGSTLYANTDNGGLYISHDTGATWTHEPRADISPGAAVAIDPSDHRVLYAPTWTGLTVSTDGGGSWRDLVISHSADGFERAAVDPTDPLTIYALSVDAGLFESTDGGATWRMIQESIAGPGWAPTGVAVLAVDPAAPNHIFDGYPGSGLRISRNGGGAWSTLPVSGPSALTVDPTTSPSTIYATGENLDYRSPDGGVTWQAGETPVPGGDVSSLAVAAPTAVAGLGAALRPSLYLGGRKVFRVPFVAATPDVHFARAFRRPRLRLPARRGVVRITLGCSNTWNSPCDGVVQLSRRSRTVGSGRFAFRMGQGGVVQIRLMPRAWSTLRRRHQMPYSARIATHGVDRTLVTYRATLRLVAR